MTEKKAAKPSGGSLSWADPAAPFVALGESLGLGREDLARREDWRIIDVPDGPYLVETLQRGMDRLADSCEAYGSALTLSLELLSEDPSRDFPEAQWSLELGEATADAGGARKQLEDFLAQYEDFASTVKISLLATLDKEALARQALGAGVTPSCMVVLFPEAFHRWFGSLDELRDLDDPDKLGFQLEARRWLVLVPAWRTGETPGGRLLTGPYLTVFGGDPHDLPEAELSRSAPSGSATAMCEQRRRHLRWDERWFSHLTPLHLMLRGAVPAEDPVVAPLRWQLTNLAVMFTADMTRKETTRVGEGAGEGWFTTYQGAERLLKVRLWDPREMLTPGPDGPDPARPAHGGLKRTELTGVMAWSELVDWVYAEKRSVGDRLAVLQNVICREVWGGDAEHAFLLLLPQMPAVLQRVKHSWKAFIEDRVDAFFTKVQNLEDHVAATVRSVADQTTALLKRLIETMLAAVAVVIAALALPAASRGEVNLRVLWWGILVYAVYVLVFPVLVGLISQYQEYLELETGFEERYQRFARQLPLYLLNQVGREPVDRGVRRYRVWFFVTIVAYLALLAALGCALLAIGARILFI